MRWARPWTWISGSDDVRGILFRRPDVHPPGGAGHDRREGSGLVRCTGLELCYSLSELELAPRVGATPRSILLPDGAKCETRDHDAVDRAAAAHRLGAPHRLLHAF